MSKYNCILLNKYEDVAIHSIFHVLILFIVLTVFFFIVVEDLEKSSLTNELVHGIENGLKNVKITKDEGTYDKLLKLAELYNKPDPTSIAYNDSLYVICIATIITLFMVLITLIFTLKYSSRKCISILNIILENMLLFVCVGVVEYLFFINIGSHYIPIVPSYIGSVINKTLNK
jgi:hypothetical protein